MVIFNFVLSIYVYSILGKIIKNGIYNFISDDLYLYNNITNLTFSYNFRYPFTFIRIKKVAQSKNITFYNIENLHKKFKLTYLDDNALIFCQNNSNSYLWNFIKINTNQFVIKNKDDCFIKLIKLKAYCEKIPINKASQFKLIKIFSEVKENMSPKYMELLNKEPIDILIKYIDLKDPNLKREYVHQIQKDFDNQELRYSIRSILKNIPWVRKIFILMPNKKVRYFKKYNLIKDKIIYLYDKDLLGYDSSNSNAFEFSYWKMKSFGISDNIIAMDDDYFFGKKLEKKDFFYIKNGIVIPLITNANFIKIDHNSVIKSIKYYGRMIKINKDEQNHYNYQYSKYLTMEFILNLFNVPNNGIIYVPNFRHNAIPVNLVELKEAYSSIQKSKFKYNTLDCTFRISGYIQFQFFLLSYTFLKYSKKVNHIPSKYINLKNSISELYKYPLFCINKGVDNYTKLELYEEIILLEYLFPTPSPYEIVNNRLINLSFYSIHLIDQLLKINNIEIKHLISQNIIFFLFLIFIVIVIITIYKIYNIYYYYNYLNL